MPLPLLWHRHCVFAGADPAAGGWHRPVHRCGCRGPVTLCRGGVHCRVFRSTPGLPLTKCHRAASERFQTWPGVPGAESLR